MTRPALPASPPALASSLRQLPAIAGLETAWQQRPEESAAEYRSFVEWLDRGATRGGPPASCALIATRHEWAERAMAYERAAALAASDARGHTPEHNIISNLTRMVQIETKKLLDMAASSPQPVVGVKDLLASMNQIQAFHDAGNKSDSAATDLSSLSEGELREWLRIQRKLKDAKRK